IRMTSKKIKNSICYSSFFLRGLRSAAASALMAAFSSLSRATIRSFCSVSSRISCTLVSKSLLLWGKVELSYRPAPRGWNSSLRDYRQQEKAKIVAVSGGYRMQQIFHAFEPCFGGGCEEYGWMVGHVLYSPHRFRVLSEESEICAEFSLYGLPVFVRAGQWL